LGGAVRLSLALAAEQRRLVAADCWFTARCPSYCASALFGGDPRSACGKQGQSQGGSPSNVLRELVGNARRTPALRLRRHFVGVQAILCPLS
jgi:hypothetical protein